MKMENYGFTVDDEDGDGDVIRIRDDKGRTYNFTMSHPAFVRFAQNITTMAIETTNREDFLIEEGREN